MDKLLQEKIDAFLAAHRDDMVRDLKTLVDIKSVAGTPAPGAPYGEGVRKIPGGPFDIVTFYEDEADRVTVLGLVHQRAAW